MGRPTANRRSAQMMRYLGALAIAASFLVAVVAAEPAVAQKAGGILRVHQWDSPPSLSIHEEVTIATVVPMMGRAFYVRLIAVALQHQVGDASSPAWLIALRRWRYPL